MGKRRLSSFVFCTSFLSSSFLRFVPPHVAKFALTAERSSFIWRLLHLSRSVLLPPSCIPANCEIALSSSFSCFITKEQKSR